MRPAITFLNIQLSNSRADENGLQNVYSEYGMYIYKISEKNY